MDEHHLRTAFVDLADAPAPPTTVDIATAVRRAHRVSITRRSMLAGGAALGLTTVAGGVFAAERWWVGAPVPGPLAVPSSEPPPVTTAPTTPTDPVGRPTLPVAPARFDAFVEWAAFGWRPDGSLTTALTIQPELVQLIAPIPGQTKERRRSVLLNLNAAGRELTPLRTGTPVEQVPDIGGRPALRAVWSTVAALRWRYAPNGWAELIVDGLPGDDVRALLTRIAASLRLSADLELRFPFRTDGVPRQLVPLITDVAEPDDGGWIRGLWLGPAGSDQSGGQQELAIEVTNSTSGTANIPYAERRANTTVDGLPAWRSRGGGRDLLAVYRPDGIRLRIDAVGSSVVSRLPAGGVVELFRRTQIFPDRTAWTDRPLG